MISFYIYKEILIRMDTECYLKLRLYIDWHLFCYVLYYIYYSLLLTLFLKPGMVVILGLIFYFIKAVYQNVCTVMGTLADKTAI